MTINNDKGELNCETIFLIPKTRFLKRQISLDLNLLKNIAQINENLNPSLD